jgi:hypothetical protein
MEARRRPVQRIGATGFGGVIGMDSSGERTVRQEGGRR